MKQLSAILLGLCLSAGLYTSCDKSEPGGNDMIYDFSPIEFKILITDNDGHDLLDSTYQDNLINDLSVTYQGKDYPLLTEQEAYNNQNLTRAYLQMRLRLGTARLMVISLSGLPSTISRRRECTLLFRNGYSLL